MRAVLGSSATPYDVDFETHAVMSLEQMGDMAQRMMGEAGPG